MPLYCLRVAELLPPAGQNLVGVALVADIPDQLILGGVEDIVQGDGQFHYPETWGKMTAGPGYRLDDEIANLLGEFLQLAGW